MATIAITPGEPKRCSVVSELLVGLLVTASSEAMKFAVAWLRKACKQRNRGPQIINATVCVASLPGLSVRGFGEVVNPPASSV